MLRISKNVKILQKSKNFTRAGSFHIISTRTLASSSVRLNSDAPTSLVAAAPITHSRFETLTPEKFDAGELNTFQEIIYGLSQFGLEISPYLQPVIDTLGPFPSVFLFGFSTRILPYFLIQENLLVKRKNKLDEIYQILDRADLKRYKNKRHNLKDFVEAENSGKISPFREKLPYFAGSIAMALPFSSVIFAGCFTGLLPSNFEIFSAFGPTAEIATWLGLMTAIHWMSYHTIQNKMKFNFSNGIGFASQVSDSSNNQKFQDILDLRRSNIAFKPKDKIHNQIYKNFLHDQEVAKNTRNLNKLLINPEFLQLTKNHKKMSFYSSLGNFVLVSILGVYGYLPASFYPYLLGLYSFNLAESYASRNLKFLENLGLRSKFDNLELSQQTKNLNFSGSFTFPVKKFDPKIDEKIFGTPFKNLKLNHRFQHMLFYVGLLVGTGGCLAKSQYSSKQEGEREQQSLDFTI